MNIWADIATGGALSLPVLVDLLQLNGEQEPPAAEHLDQFLALLHRVGACHLDLGPDGTGQAVLVLGAIVEDTLQHREVHRLHLEKKKLWTAWHGVHRWE